MLLQNYGYMKAPVYMKNVLDELTGPNRLQVIVPDLLMIALYTALTVISMFLMRKLIIGVSRKVEYELRARIIKAMAHPTRLFIVDELSRGEQCVCELTEMIGADTSTVSKHLSILKNAGIVADDKRGLQVFYRLKVPCVLNFFKCVESVIAENIKEQMSAAE